MAEYKSPDWSLLTAFMESVKESLASYSKESQGVAADSISTAIMSALQKQPWWAGK